MKPRSFQAAVGALSRFNLVAVALVVLASGALAPRLGAPPSHCAAPPSHYQAAVLLNYFAVITVYSSFCATTGVKFRLALVTGDGGRLQNKATLPRLYFLVAVVLSAASVGFALAACFYAVQIKAGVLACMPRAVRAALHALIAIMGADYAYVYGSLAIAAVASE